MYVKETKVNEPSWGNSIISRDIIYRVSFFYKSKLIERLESDYFGALNPKDGAIMYTGFTLPSIDYPMNSIRSVYGKIVLTVECDFYNVTNNEIVVQNIEEFDIFVMHPSLKVSIFSLLIATSGMTILKGSGPTIKVKNIWEKIKKEYYDNILMKPSKNIHRRLTVG